MRVSSRKIWIVLLTLMASILAAGCSGEDLKLAETKELVIGDIGWDEGIAISNLTKALLEDELDYDSVELQTLDIASLLEGMSSGETDAFQDVWLPNHQEYLSEVQNDIDLLEPWYTGITRVGIAAPSYMNITSIPQLNQTATEEIGGIKQEARISKRISEEVIPAYHLKQEYSPWDAPAAMLFEVDKRLSNREPFAFVAWSPHWMNQEYDLVYLDDPQDALGGLDDSSRITTAVRKGLAEDEPEAYALMEALTLTEEQVNDLEGAINAAGNPLSGARTWANNNRDVAQPWIEAANQARQES